MDILNTKKDKINKRLPFSDSLISTILFQQTKTALDKLR